MTKRVTLAMIVVVTLLIMISIYKFSAGDKEKNLEVHIEEAMFVQASDISPYSPNNKEALMKIDLKIINKTSEPMTIRPQTDIVLYDDEEQIDGYVLYGSNLEIDILPKSTVNIGKQKNMSVFFEVELDKLYDMHIAPVEAYGKEVIDDVTLPLDVSEYREKYIEIDEPAKLIEMYINSVYLHEEIEELAKWLDVDITSLREEAKKNFLELLKFNRSEHLSDKLANRFHEEYLKKLRDESKIEVSIYMNSGSKAIVNIDYYLPSTRTLLDKVTYLKFENIRGQNNLTLENLDKKVHDQLEQMITDVEMEKGQLQVYLKKQGEQWEFDKNYFDIERRIGHLFGKID